jgi:hypothetical protein
MLIALSLLALISIPIGLVLVVLGTNDLEKSLTSLAKILDERYTQWDPKKSIPLPKKEEPPKNTAAGKNSLLAGLNLPGGPST